ncbi:MAG TPA: hypothetical protein P5123_05200, partial [Spirochaetota bacterium]|nr:hypothetical protein [Spirochaetota bacterium]
MKKNSKYLISDLIFTFACLLIMSGTSYALYQDINERIDFSKNQQVGHIVFKRNSAQRKYASYSVWEHLNQKSPLYNKDTIRTSENSDVRLVLEGGIEVALEQQSLIFVMMTPRGFEIDFQGGEIHSIAVNRMTVKYRNSTITLEKGTNFSLCELDNNSVELTVNKGSAHVENSDAGIIKNVTDNESATITSNNVQITALQFRDCFPPNNTILVSPDDKMPVNLTWKTEVSGTKVIVARNVQFSEIVASKENAENLNIDLSPGLYYWKLISNSTESRTFSFEILKEKTPLIISPANNSNLIKSDKGFFEISWLTRGRADSYQVNIYKDGSDSPIESALTKNNSTMLDMPAEGTYQLVVTPIYHFGAAKKDMNSEAITVYVNSSAEKIPVKVLTPSAQTAISLEAALHNGILCSWNSTRGKCRVELFSDNGSGHASGDPIFSEETEKNSIRLTGNFKTGSYIIRVTPLSNSYSEGETHFQLNEGVGLTLISPTINSHFKAGSDITF